MHHSMVIAYECRAGVCAQVSLPLCSMRAAVQRGGCSAGHPGAQLCCFGGPVRPPEAGCSPRLAAGRLLRPSCGCAGRQKGHHPAGVAAGEIC